MVLLTWLISLVIVGVLYHTAGSNTSNNLDLPGTDSQAATDLLEQQFPPQQNGKNPIVFQTTGQNSLTVMGAPGAGITICSGPIASPTSPRIMITQAGIIITNGVATITVAGPVVDINNGALTIT